MNGRGRAILGGVLEGVMDDVVTIELEVSAEAAEFLRDVARRDAMGRTVSLLATDEGLRKALLFAVLRAIQDEAEAAGLTDGDIEWDLASYKAERRARCERDRQRGAA